jgi:hypothetical protein
MSNQNDLLALMFKQSQIEDRKAVPRILVPYTANSTTAINQAIQNGFPVTKCPPRYCAPTHIRGNQ